jgi:hypothetical protein
MGQLRPIRIVTHVVRRTFASRPINSLNAPAPPRLWQAACLKVPYPQLLPEFLGGPSNQPYRAFVGDKILGATAARVLEETISGFPENYNTNELSVITLDKGCATELFSIALSNRFLHAHAKLLLPKECMELVVGSNMSDHSVGTMVEATVAAVDEFDKEAVSDLARWLITGATSIWIEANPKGRLLERGGRVKALRIGGPDHDPIFQGIAKMDGQKQVVAQASDRKSAERAAARKLLISLGLFTDEDDSFWAEKISSDESAVISSNTDSQRLNEWVPFDFNPDFDSWTLKHGESRREWWVRNAFKPSESFRRALLAPRIFDQIEHVDSWTRNSSESAQAEEQTTSSYATVMIVVASKDRFEKAATKYTCFIEEGGSKSKARGLAGTRANRFIGALVGLEDKHKEPE